MGPPCAGLGRTESQQAERRAGLSAPQPLRGQVLWGKLQEASSWAESPPPAGVSRAAPGAAGTEAGALQAEPQGTPALEGSTVSARIEFQESHQNVDCSDCDLTIRLTQGQAGHCRDPDTVSACITGKCRPPHSPSAVPRELVHLSWACPEWPRASQSRPPSASPHPAGTVLLRARAPLSGSTQGWEVGCSGLRSLDGASTGSLRDSAEGRGFSLLRARLWSLGCLWFIDRIHFVGDITNLPVPEVQRGGPGDPRP